MHPLQAAHEPLVTHSGLLMDAEPLAYLRFSQHKQSSSIGERHISCSEFKQLTGTQHAVMANKHHNGS